MNLYIITTSELQDTCNKISASCNISKLKKYIPDTIFKTEIIKSSLNLNSIEKLPPIIDYKQKFDLPPERNVYFALENNYKLSLNNKNSRKERILFISDNQDTCNKILKYIKFHQTQKQFYTRKQLQIYQQIQQQNQSLLQKIYYKIKNFFCKRESSQKEQYGICPLQEDLYFMDLYDGQKLNIYKIKNKPQTNEEFIQRLLRNKTTKNYSWTILSSENTLKIRDELIKKNLGDDFPINDIKIDKVYFYLNTNFYSPSYLNYYCKGNYRIIRLPDYESKPRSLLITSHMMSNNKGIDINDFLFEKDVEYKEFYDAQTNLYLIRINSKHQNKFKDFNWFSAYQIQKYLYGRNAVQKIENWILEIMYNPEYKHCFMRKKDLAEIEEAFNDLIKETENIER